MAYCTVAKVASLEKLLPVDAGSRLCIFGFDIVLRTPIFELCLAVVSPE